MTYLPIDYFAAILGLVGMYLLPTRRKTSIVLFLIGNAIWLAWSFQTGNWGVAFNYIVMGALNARTLWTWAGEARAVKLELTGATL